MKTLLTTLAICFAPAAVYAIPIEPGNSYGEAFTLNPGDIISFDFEVDEPVYISPIAISGTGATVADLLSVTFGVDEFEAKITDTVFLGNVAAGFAVLEGFLATSDFSLLLTDGVENPVQLTFNFVTSVPSPVPLPAAGFLLAGGLSLLGVGSALKRRRGNASGS